MTYDFDAQLERETNKYLKELDKAENKTESIEDTLEDFSDDLTDELFEFAVEWVELNLGAEHAQYFKEHYTVMTLCTN